jgi:hypothetical protein
LRHIGASWPFQLADFAAFAARPLSSHCKTSVTREYGIREEKSRLLSVVVIKPLESFAEFWRWQLGDLSIEASLHNRKALLTRPRRRRSRMTVQQIQQSAAPVAAAPSAEMDNLHLRESQGGAAPQGVQPQTAQMDTPPVATQQASPRGTQAPILTGAERRLSEHHDYEEGLLRAAHERKQAAEAEAFLAAETKKAQALLARKVADADAEVKLAAAKAAEREAKVQVRLSPSLKLFAFSRNFRQTVGYGTRFSCWMQKAAAKGAKVHGRKFIVLVVFQKETDLQKGQISEELCGTNVQAQMQRWQRDQGLD